MSRMNATAPVVPSTTLIGVPATSSRPRGRLRSWAGVAVSAAVLLVVVVFALAGQWIAPYSASAQNPLIRLHGSSAAHWLGTDDLGRDVLSRLIVGSRDALYGPLVIAVVSIAIGLVLGVLAGYLGGATDMVISRWIDLMYSLPSLLVAIVVIGVIGGGYWVAVGVLCVLFIPFNARILRGIALEQRGRPYVESARVMGLGRWAIMLKHITPNCLPLAVSTGLLDFGFGLVSLAGLAFLGLSVPPGSADWGAMISEGLQFVYTAPLSVISASIALVVLAVAANYLGDRIYDIWMARRQDA